ncbi:MAG: signal recognition particle protein Srp19 [Promethearchaeota archaeon]|nr:MAG: signal recognition particle protein Srp19 [Candidatus Lokiarchaeota archaeon]
MRSRKPFIIYWPQYFEAKRSRADGRRVPKKFAVDKVKPSDIALAAKRLGYNVQQENIYKYPKTWWDDSGRVLIDTKGKKKSKVLIEIAKELKKGKK